MSSCAGVSAMKSGAAREICSVGSSRPHVAQATPAAAVLRDFNVRPAVAYHEGSGWGCAYAGYQAFQPLGVGLVLGNVLETDDMREVAVDAKLLLPRPPRRRADPQPGCRAFSR